MINNSQYYSSIDNNLDQSLEQLNEYVKKRKFLKEKVSKTLEERQEYISLKKDIRILKDQHMPLRITGLAKRCWKKKEVFPELLKYKSVFNELVSAANGLSKEDSKKYWVAAEKNLIDLFSTLDPIVLKTIAKVHLIHGTNSAILAFLPFTNYDLIPTGALIKSKKIAPMCGELNVGIGSRGINNTSISLETIRNIKRSWDYAAHISNSFKFELFSNPEEIIQDCLAKLLKLHPIENDSGWSQTIVKLMQLKQYKPQEFYQLIQNSKEKIEKIKFQISKEFVSVEQLALEALETPTKDLKALYSSSNLQSLEKKWNEKEIYFQKDWSSLKGTSDFAAVLDLTYSFLTRDDLDHHLEDTISCIFKMKLFGKEMLRNLSYFPNTYYTYHVWKKLAADLNLKKDLPKIWEKVLKKSQEIQIKGDVDNTPHFFLQDLLKNKYRAFQSFVGFSPLTADEYEGLSNFILDDYLLRIIKTRMNNQLFFLQEHLAQLDQLLEPLPFHFSEEDLALIANPYPMLLASTTFKPYKKHLVGDELTAQKIPFGVNGIDLIYVKNENRSHLEGWLKRNNFETQVAIVDIVPLLQADKKLPFYHADTQIKLESAFFPATSLQNVNYVLDSDAVSFYKKPYPNGQKRVVHGIPHAVGTAFCTYILANLFHEKNIPLGVSKELLILFAFLHDSGRENDGPDQKSWEEASAKNTTKIALRAYPNLVSEIPILEEAVIDKDNKITNKVTEAKKIIHAADAFELLRCLRDVKDFHPHELWLSGLFSKEEISELIFSINKFILLREDPLLKTWLENANSPFAALFQLLEYACKQNPQTFAKLAHLASSGIRAFCNPTESQLSDQERERITTLCKD